MSTHKSTWKAFERTVAAFWGSTRTALSGGNSKITRSDSLHPELFVECKYRASNTLHTLYKKTKELACKEGKTPVICTKTKGESGFLITVHSSDYEKLMRGNYGCSEPNGLATDTDSEDS